MKKLAGAVKLGLSQYIQGYIGSVMLTKQQLIGVGHVGDRRSKFAQAFFKLVIMDSSTSDYVVAAGIGDLEGDVVIFNNVGARQLFWVNNQKFSHATCHHAISQLVADTGKVKVVDSLWQVLDIALSGANSFYNPN